MANISVDGGLKLRDGYYNIPQRASHIIGATSGFHFFAFSISSRIPRSDSPPHFPPFIRGALPNVTRTHGRRLDFFPPYYHENSRAVRERSRIEIGFSLFVASNYHLVIAGVGD